MTRQTLSLIVAFAALSLHAGCKSKQEEAVELRSELRTLLDGAYAAYGGGSMANQAREQARQEAQGQSPQDKEAAATSARFVGEVDRTFFEQYCLAYGRGERPFNLSDKLEAFMKDPKNVTTCQKAAKLEIKLDKLQDAAAK